MDKAELIITALQQRIGELVSNYETQFAVLRAEITQLSEQDKEKNKVIEDYTQALKQKSDNEEIYLNEKEALHTRIRELEKVNETTKKNTSKTTK